MPRRENRVSGFVVRTVVGGEEGACNASDVGFEKPW